MEFNKKISLRFMTDYNQMLFWTSDYKHGFLHSNRPVDIGLGMGYGDITLDVTLSLPSTSEKGKKRSAGYETGLDFFPNKLWLQIKYRKYSGFNSDEVVHHVKDSTGTEDSIRYEEEFINLHQRDIMVSGLWMFTDNFSIRAPYLLDRIQSKTSQAFLVGGKLVYTSAEDWSGFLKFYDRNRKLFSAWANVGYSKTWVFKKNIFFNVWALAGALIGYGSGGMLPIFPEISGKVAGGQWFDNWAWNMVMETSYVPIVFLSHVEQRLNSSFKILVVKRF